MKELIFHRLLLPTAERQASDPAFTDVGTGEQVTFGQHAERVKQLANGLRSELGVEAGDRVAVLSMNRLAYVELWHAALFGACVLNPLNNRFSGPELGFVLGDSGSRVCFVDQAFAPLIDEIRKEAGVETVVLMGEGDVPHDVRYNMLVEAGSPATPAEPEEDDAAVFMYTGGTRGTPKGVLLEHRAEILNQHHIAMSLPWVREWPFLIQTPIFHGASMLGVIGAPAFGVPSVILPAFDPGTAIRAIDDHRIGFTVMVPTMIQMVLGHPSFTPEALVIAQAPGVRGVAPQQAGCPRALRPRGSPVDQSKPTPNQLRRPPLHPRVAEPEHVDVHFQRTVRLPPPHLMGRVAELARIRRVLAGHGHEVPAPAGRGPVRSVPYDLAGRVPHTRVERRDICISVDGFMVGGKGDGVLLVQRGVLVPLPRVPVLSDLLLHAHGFGHFRIALARLCPGVAGAGEGDAGRHGKYHSRSRHQGPAQPPAHRGQCRLLFL
jgi:AMP-binding enzyme